VATLLEDMVTYLKGRGLVNTDGVDVFRDFVPTAPDTVVILSEFAGNNLGKGAGAGERIVQIVTRSPSATAAQNKALLLYLVFDAEDENITMLTSTRWSIIRPKHSPFKAAVDESNRILYAFTLSVTTTFD
jgi:hypothetical protein